MHDQLGTQLYSKVDAKHSKLQIDRSRALAMTGGCWVVDVESKSIDLPKMAPNGGLLSSGHRDLKLIRTRTALTITALTRPPANRLAIHWQTVIEVAVRAMSESNCGE